MCQGTGFLFGERLSVNSAGIPAGFVGPAQTLPQPGLSNPRPALCLAPSVPANYLQDSPEQPLPRPRQECSRPFWSARRSARWQSPGAERVPRPPSVQVRSGIWVPSLFSSSLDCNPEVNHLGKFGENPVSRPQCVGAINGCYRPLRQNWKIFPFCGYYRGFKRSCLVAASCFVSRPSEEWLSCPSGLDMKGYSDPSWPAGVVAWQPGSSAPQSQDRCDLSASGLGLPGPSSSPLVWVRIRGERCS